MLELAAQRIAQKEAELARSLDQVQHVLATIMDAWFVLDSTLCFLEINPAARRMLFKDKPDSELIGRNFWDVFPQGRGTEFQEQYQRAVAEQIEVHFEARSRIVDKWFETHAFPRQGKLEVYIRDITDRKRAELALAASEREFRAIFELAGAGTAQADLASRRFVRVNRRFCEITGYSEAELLTMNYSDLTHPEDRAHEEEVLAPVRRGECDTWELEKRYTRKDGRIVWVLVDGSAIRDESGKPFRTIATIIDITARRASEDALKEADRRKDEFLATLAHELRNPLAPISNAVYLLRELLPQDPKLQRARAVIDRQVQQLARLVDDLLDVSRITRGKVTLRMERIELGAAIDRAIETARPVIEAAHHELIVEVPDVPIPVTADLVRLSQIISNLLHNAAKYTKSGGRIRLVVQIAPSNAEVSIRVQDSGIGIAREQLCKVFEPFAQVDSSISRSQGGLGIGLTIVKRLTELHGGGVSVHSEGVGRGSEFVVRLPLPKEDCRDESAAAANKAAHAFALLPISPVQSADAAPRVLVVDDNIDSADTLQVMLRAAGYEAETAYSGESALHAALANPPQVVLLDLGMPGMSGLEVARCLRENQRTQGAVLIAMTGWGQAEDRRRTQEAGFDHHLVKPIDIAALSALLQARSHQPRRG